MAKLTRKFSWPTGRRLKQWCTNEKNDTLKMAPHDASKEALGMECELQIGIRADLTKIYKSSGTDVYYHLGPQYAGSRLSLNDVSEIEASSKNTHDVLQKSRETIGNVARQDWVIAN